jgi:hypothetical protein
MVYDVVVDLIFNVIFEAGVVCLNDVMCNYHNLIVALRYNDESKLLEVITKVSCCQKLSHDSVLFRADL